MKARTSGRIDPTILCMSCGKPNVIPPNFFQCYFLQEKYSACNCGSVASAWQQALHTIKTNFMLTNALDLVGANSTITTFEMKEGESYTLNFINLGIPKNAKILHINFTPTCKLHPLEIYNSTHLNRNIRAESVSLYPMPFGEKTDTTPKSGVINALITWIPDLDDDSKTTMVEAFEYYIRGMYQSIIVPANVVIETKLTGLMSEVIKEKVNKKIFESFLSSTPSYSNQLNLMLPLLLFNTGIPLMDLNLLDVVNKLRKARNISAHSARSHVTTREDAALFLTGALFTFHYLDFVETRLQLVQ